MRRERNEYKLKEKSGRGDYWPIEIAGLPSSKFYILLQYKMPIDLQPSTPSALVCAVLADSAEMLIDAKIRLAQCFGPLYASSEIYDFDFTAYYEAEMGAGLCKQLVCFAERIDPAELAACKGQTIELEKVLGKATGGTWCRRANIDPGLLSIESLVLATTKYAGHRVCIARRLYAEVTLLYQRGRYRPLEWTYPDYRSDAVQRFLLDMRSWLLRMRGGGQPRSSSGTNAR